MGINGIYHKYMYNYNGWSKFFWLFIFLNKISSSGSLTNFTRSLSYSSLFSTRSLATLVLATAEYQAAADFYNVHKGNNPYVTADESIYGPLKQVCSGWVCVWETLEELAEVNSITPYSPNSLLSFLAHFNANLGHPF